jgi:hypothetical protein
MDLGGADWGPAWGWGGQPSWLPRQDLSAPSQPSSRKKVHWVIGQKTFPHGRIHASSVFARDRWQIGVCQVQCQPNGSDSTRKWRFQGRLVGRLVAAGVPTLARPAVPLPHFRPTCRSWPRSSTFLPASSRPQFLHVGPGKKGNCLDTRTGRKTGHSSCSVRGDSPNKCVRAGVEPAFSSRRACQPYPTLSGVTAFHCSLFTSCLNRVPPNGRESGNWSGCQESSATYSRRPGADNG